MSSVELSLPQIEHFNEFGFLLLKAADHGLVTPSQLQEWTREVRTLPRQKGEWMPYDEINIQGERQIMRTENFSPYHENFDRLLNGRPMSALLEQVTGDDMLLFKEKINYKLPGGNGFRPHLDAPAYDHIAKIEHTTANLAVDAATLDNGCIEVVLGSHKMDVPLSNGGHISEEWVAEHEWLPVPLEPGDMLIFGSHLAHRSGSNKTDKSRTSVYATYHMRSDGDDLRQRYYAHRRENFPPDHERIPGKDYNVGVQRYAFAAPFTSVEHPKVLPSQAV